MIRRTWVVWACVFPFCLSGCALPRPYKTLEIAAPAARGHVLIIPGILGDDWGTRRFCRMIPRESGGEVSAQVWDWTAHPALRCRSLLDRLDPEVIRPCADELARGVRRWRESHGESPLHVIAISGGPQVLLMACESLPAESLGHVVFLSAAFDADRDLTALHRTTRGEVFNYWSTNDSVLTFVPYAAGRVGICTCPGEVRGLSWDRLSRKDRLGNRGGHAGSYAPRFAKQFVIPVVTSQAPGAWKFRDSASK